MIIDTIKKKDQKSNETINLKSKKEQVFKFNIFSRLTKNKKNVFFYFLLFFVMSILIFFWSLNLKDVLQKNKMKSKEDIEKYNEIKFLYNSLKENLENPIKDIKSSFDNLKSKESIIEDKSIINEESADNLNKAILNSLNKDQKKQILDNSIIKNDNVIPLEFNQEELKVRLKMLEENK